MLLYISRILIINCRELFVTLKRSRNFNQNYGIYIYILMLGC